MAWKVVFCCSEAWQKNLKKLSELKDEIGGLIEGFCVGVGGFNQFIVTFKMMLPCKNNFCLGTISFVDVKSVRREILLSEIWPQFMKLAWFGSLNYR